MVKRLNVERARALRVAQTDAERALWRRLRNRVLLDWKFRRQHEIGPYIVDFVCTDAGLIVELDGGQHLEQVERTRRALDGFSAPVIVCCDSGMMTC